MHNAIVGWWNDTARAGDATTTTAKHFYSDAPWNATQPALKPVYAHSNCDPVSPRSKSLHGLNFAHVQGSLTLTSVF